MTIHYPRKWTLRKEEFPIGKTAFKFQWKGQKIIACDLCTEPCVPILHPNDEPPS